MDYTNMYVLPWCVFQGQFLTWGWPEGGQTCSLKQIDFNCVWTYVDFIYYRTINLPHFIRVQNFLLLQVENTEGLYVMFRALRKHVSFKYQLVEVFIFISFTPTCNLRLVKTVIETCLNMKINPFTSVHFIGI